MSGGGETSRAPRFRTPLKRALGLGSGHSGTEHFWKQRVTAVILAPLAIWFVVTLVSLVGADLETARAIIARPWNAIIFAVFLVTTLIGVTGLWPAVLADTGATVLVTANALRLLRKKL